MSLIKWELMKIFKQKSLYFVALFLFGWFTLVLFTNMHETTATREVFNEWEGPITTEKLAAAEKLNAEVNEFFSKENAVNERKSAEAGLTETIAMSQNIASTIKEREDDLNQLIKKVEANGNHSLAAKLKLQKDMYNEVKIDKISYYKAPQEAVDFVNVFGLILTGAFLLIGLCGIYSNEHASGVENYILSAKKGRKATMQAKLMAASIFAVAVVVLWEAFNLISRTAVYGTKGWDLPIQYSFKYFFSPYSLTFMEYHMIQIALHILAAIAFAGLIVLVSTLSKSTVISFFVSGFLFGTPILAQSIMNVETIWVNKMLTLTLTNIMKVEELFMNFISYNVFGYPVLAPYVGIAIAVAVLVGAVVLSVVLIERKQIV
ncbi:hypothetical protein V7201_17660 [Bacillus sp. JJ1122]|uniref:hypothetical protein n=1 Tax=Bacillus sp. JJ1122 TaxID=3122951 RepID=UPI002FFDCB38